MHRLLYFILRRIRIFEILENQNQIKREIQNQNKMLEEIHKAQIFNSTITDSQWLNFKSFSPGVWAADYGLLYTLYRVLNGIKPQTILEFGLGQSSKMIHQYANYFKALAITCEHDDRWIKFFNDGKDGEYNVNVQKVDLLDVEYKGQKTLTYKGIQEIFKGQRFDLIVVDGPFGQEHYSRPQIIDLVKNNLNNSFCILIDDYERAGEQETGKEILDYLDLHNVKYHTKIYSSEKKHLLLCSNDLKFLTSL